MLALKTSTCGRLHRAVVYTPPVSRGSDQLRQHRRNATTNAKRFINCRNQIENLSLIIAGNFDKENAVFITLTYEDSKLPSKKAAVKSHYEKFTREVRKALKLKGKTFEYARSIEGQSAEDEPEAKNPCGIGYELKPWGDKEKWAKEGKLDKKAQTHGDTDPIRFHCHIITVLSPSDYDTVRSLWPHGHAYIARINTNDRESFPKLASYMTKDARKGNTRVGERCFSCSKGLARPVITFEWVEEDTLSAPPDAFIFEDSLDGTSKWSYCHRLGYIEPISSSFKPTPTQKQTSRKHHKRKQKEGETSSFTSIVGDNFLLRV